MKNRFSLLPVLLLSLIAAPCLASTPVVDLADLVPSPEHKQATRLVTRFVSQYHFKKTRLDDALSERIFDRYLESLDPSRSYFLAGDIEALSRYRKTFDDLLQASELDPAFRIFRLFRIRSDQRVEYALKALKQEFDFSREEEYLLDRKEAPWAVNKQELDEIWRRRVKNDVLTLRLAGKDHEQVLETLSKRYERLGRRIAQLGPNDVYQLFMNAYAGTVEPHTAYFSPRTSENFKIHLSLSLEGIGAALRTEDEYTVVQRIIAGGPADLSGQLHAEDRITGVGQGEAPIEDVVAWRLEDVVDLIRGPKGSVVRLEVSPKDGVTLDRRKVVTLVRDKIKLEEQAAKKQVIETAGGRIGVIDIPTFYMDIAAQSKGDEDYRSTSRDVRRLLAEMEADRVDGVVIDLRGNGGGALVEAIALTGLFIETGPVVQVKDSGGRIKVEEDPDPGVAYRGPLAVLVDRYSASASEIFAGAVQDYHRGLVIGEPTYGKGTVQSLVNLDRFVKDPATHLGQLKTTIAQFFRVNGDSTQHRGVVPDIIYPTAFDANDSGERSLDNALPWARVEQAHYRPFDAASGSLGLVRGAHERRLRDDPAFGLLLAEARARKAAREKVSTTLVEDKRRAEREARESVRKARDRQFRAAVGLAPAAEDDLEDEAETAHARADVSDEDKLKADVWLRETARILRDLIGAGGRGPAILSKAGV